MYNSFEHIIYGWVFTGFKRGSFKVYVQRLTVNALIFSQLIDECVVLEASEVVDVFPGGGHHTLGSVLHEVVKKQQACFHNITKWNLTSLSPIVKEFKSRFFFTSHNENNILNIQDSSRRVHCHYPRKGSIR